MSGTTLDAYLALPVAWNPPSTEKELQQTAETLAMSWPAEVEALYRRHDGSSGLAEDWEERWAEQVADDEDAWPNVPRLMPLTEVRDFYEGTRSFVMPELRLFWNDDNSNYVGVYVGEIFTGAVCLFHHEYQSEVGPRFGSVSEFLTWVTEHPSEDVFSSESVPQPYPRTQAAPETDARDWMNAQALYARAEDLQEDNPMLAVAMNVTPVGQNDALLPYLESSDFYIAERAVEILSARQYPPARAAIEWLALHGVSNARIAAQRAISSWRLSEP